MNNAEKWVIRNTHGQLLQSFAIDPEQIRVNWFRPDAPGKTKAGEKGPLNLLAESKAQVLLMALVSQVPTEFAGAKVMTLAQALSPLASYATGAPVVITGNVKTIQPPALKAGLGPLPFHDFSSAEVKPFDLSGFKITDLIHIGPPVPSTPPANGSSWLNGVEAKASIPELVAQYLQGMVGVMLDFEQKQTLIAVLTKVKADVTLSDLSDALTQYEVLTPFRDALQKCQNSGGFGHLFTQNADV